MAGDTTTHNYGWIKPELHSSPVDWGNKINGDLDLIDAKVFTLNQGVTEKNQLVINKKTVAAGNPIYGQLNGVTRWVLELGDGTAESGSNVGSNFAVYRYADSGTYIDAPFYINRATGQAYFTKALTCSATILATSNVNINGGPNAVLNLCDSTGAGKGAVYWEASGGTVVLSKSGGAYVQLLTSAITLSQPTTVLGGFTATSGMGCKSSISISATSASDNAYTGFFNSGGARQGYVGWLNSGTVVLAKDGGANVALTSVVALNGNVIGSGTATFTGVSVAGSISASGNISAGGTIVAGGAFSSGGTISSNGNTIFGGNGAFTGSMSISGALTSGSHTVSGTVTVSQGTNPAVYLNDSGGTRGILFYDTAAAKVTLTSNAAAGVNIAINPDQTFAYNGGPGTAIKNGGGSWTAPSDLRIKKDIADYKGSLKDILQLRPVTYRYRTGDGTSYVGLVAQEAELAMPELVLMGRGDIDGKEVSDFRSLDPSALVYALINSCKELAARVDVLEAALANRSS